LFQCLVIYLFQSPKNGWKKEVRILEGDLLLLSNVSTDIGLEYE